MTARLDLIVAGGGPAGLATALYARRAGLTVAVVEPRPAPIDKACGEGLMPAALAGLDDLLGGPAQRPAGVLLRGIRYHGAGACVQATFRAGPGLGVQRVALHTALSAAARSAGVELVRGRVAPPGTVRSEANSGCASPGRDGVRLDPGGVSAAGLRARYLVAADGLHSRLRTLVDPGAVSRTPVRHRWGVRAHLPIAPWTDFVEVYWGVDGEAYVTPVGPGCVSVAILGGRGGSFDARLAQFPALAEQLSGARPGPVLGAGPLRQDVRRRVRGRVLLVGDAAGYVDALTGEGLALAFGCARAAVARIASDEPARYECDYRVISRRYRLITVALLRVAASARLRRGLVPAAARLPWLFDVAVDGLARPAGAVRPSS